MVRKTLLAAAIASQALIGTAYAAPARPEAVSFSGTAPIGQIAAPVRASTSTGEKNDLVGVPFLLPLLGLVAVVVVVAVVASDGNSSPN